MQVSFQLFKLAHRMMVLGIRILVSLLVHLPHTISILLGRIRIISASNHACLKIISPIYSNIIILHRIPKTITIQSPRPKSGQCLLTINISAPKINTTAQPYIYNTIYSPELLTKHNTYHDNTRSCTSQLFYSHTFCQISWPINILFS